LLFYPEAAGITLPEKQGAFMKIIQLFWSKPAFDLMSVRYNGGWLERKYYFMSLCFSCLLLKRQYHEVELITDEYGKQLLIDELHLPYTSVKIELNKFDDCHRDLGIIVKLSCFEKQQLPFLYVEGDLFLCDRFDERKVSAPLIVKNEVDFETPVLYEFLHYIQKNMSSGSKGAVALNNDVEESDKGYDLSVFGGCDTTFISAFARESLSFLNRNIEFLNDNIDFEIRDNSMFFDTTHSFDQVNSMIESYFLTAYARRYGKRAECVTEPPDPGEANDNQLLKMRPRSGYIHIVHENKRKLEICNQLEYQLREQFADQYYAILSGLREFRI
jgi:hypothetical protein